MAHMAVVQRYATVQNQWAYYQYYTKAAEQAQNSRKRKLLCWIVDHVIEKKKKSDEVRIWVSSLCRFRDKHGFYKNIFPLLHIQNNGYYQYLRMDATQLEQLLLLIGPMITKRDYIRKSIDPKQRLCLTLRYLASEDSFESLHYSYLIGISTIYSIIFEICEVIWNTLQPLVLPGEFTEYDWIRLADQFEEQWNFPSTISCIYGKHVVLKCPENSMSYNYKGTYSVVLLAMCDANYKFTFVDIGAYGRRSDVGIFRDSEFGRKFENGEMNLPKPRKISPRRPPLPFVILGDEAFLMKTYLMRPYPGKNNVEPHKRIFNYRLSRARRMIECCFGILAARWRIYARPMDISDGNSIKIVKATLVLHNWLRQNDINNRPLQRYLPDPIELAGVDSSALCNITRTGANNPTLSAIDIREEFCFCFSIVKVLWIFSMSMLKLISS